MNSVNGLDSSSAGDILYSNIIRFKSTRDNLNNAFSVIIGLITAIAVIAFAIYRSQFADRTFPTNFYHFVDGNFTQVKSMDSSLAFLYIFGTTCAFIPVAFTAAGIFNRIIEKFYIERDVDTLTKFRLNISELDPSKPLPDNKIIPLLKIVDKVARVSSMETMNFTQLAEARKYLGNKEFSKAIAGKDGEDHAFWREILEIKNPLELEDLLASDNFKAVLKNRPELSFGIYDLFHERLQYSEIVEKYGFKSNPEVAV